MMSITAYIDKYFTFLVFIVDFEQLCLQDTLIGKPPNREIPVQKQQKILEQMSMGINQVSLLLN